MERGNFETPERASPEDREHMERLAREAREVLATAEAAPQETVLKESEEMLAAETEKEVGLLENAFGEIFENPEFVKELFEKFKDDLGWEEGKSRAMVGVLQHAVNELHRTRLATPDEKNPHPEGQTRDARNVLLSLIADDYGAEVMRGVAPLINIFVEKGHEIIAESKKENGGEGAVV
ncbi:MAG: hypothetical protein Q8P88_01690 [Candidatus Jorgensenbacteria bacterium]|nr:hypothetical protein [Candidatus Jorgensenbacteria bacterium]